MRRLLLLTWVLASACNESPKADAPAPKAKVHQLDLGGRIFKGVEKLPADADSGEDAARSLAEIVVAGYAPRLRMIVSGDNPILAKGAARALVSIRVEGDADRAATLTQCARSETNPLVREECARLTPPLGDAPRVAPGSSAVVSALESSDPEKRRAALRLWLDARPMLDKADPDLLLALSDRLKDDDARVRLLAAAALLRVTPVDER